MANKSTADERGNQIPEGVITELQTNDGNKLLELVIIPYPTGTLRDTHVCDSSIIMLCYV